jgi:hypothetical protein
MAASGSFSGLWAVRFSGSIFMWLLACFSNDYVLYIPVAVPVFPKWTSKSSRLLPNSHLHCNDLDRIHRTPLTNTMSSHGNDTPGAPGTGSILGYILNYIWFIILFMFISEISINTSIYFVFAKSLIYVMKLITIFGIKIYQKRPIFLTMSLRKYPSRESKTTRSGGHWPLYCMVLHSSMVCWSSLWRTLKVECKIRSKHWIVITLSPILPNLISVGWVITFVVS